MSDDAPMMNFFQRHFWKITVLLAPWQTRWFAEGVMMGTVPLEASRLSVYVSMLAMIVFIVGTWWRIRPRFSWNIFLPVVCCGYLFLLSSVFPFFSVLWMMNAFVIVAWIWALHKTVELHAFMYWFVMALLPHAFLAVIQFIVQFVWGSKWLGIATQNPTMLGVSVLLLEGKRVLRAYGGFSHPNILGGWMAVGALIALMYSFDRHVRRWVWVGLSGVFMLALVLSFSRSAWMMFFLALMGVAIRYRTGLRKTGFWKQLTAGGCLFFVLLGLSFPLWRSRAVMENRLEVKSVNERAQVFAYALPLIQQRPWLGVGLGSGAAMLDVIHGPFPAPLYPHSVFLMMFLEIGAFGVLCFLLLALYWARRFSPLIWIVLCMPVFFLDHYFWSFWSGQMLFGLILFFSLHNKAMFLVLTEDSTIGQSVVVD
jgi:hypothetical protein